MRVCVCVCVCVCVMKEDGEINETTVKFNNLSSWIEPINIEKRETFSFAGSVDLLSEERNSVQLWFSERRKRRRTRPYNYIRKNEYCIRSSLGRGNLFRIGLFRAMISDRFRCVSRCVLAGVTDVNIYIYVYMYIRIGRLKGGNVNVSQIYRRETIRRIRWWGELYRRCARYRSRRITSGTGTPKYTTLLTIFVQVLKRYARIPPGSDGALRLTDKLTINIFRREFYKLSRDTRVQEMEMVVVGCLYSVTPHKRRRNSFVENRGSWSTCVTRVVT